MFLSRFIAGACVAFCALAASYDLSAETRKQTAASYIDLGDKFAQQGDLQRAIGAYTIALQFAPDFVPARGTFYV